MEIFGSTTTNRNFNDIIEMNFGHFGPKIYITPFGYLETSFDANARMILVNFLDYVKNSFNYIGNRLDFLYGFEEGFLMLKFLGTNPNARNIVLEKISQLRYMGLPLIVMESLPIYHFNANILGLDWSVDKVRRSLNKSNTLIALDTAKWDGEIIGEIPGGFRYHFQVNIQNFMHIRSSNFNLNLDQQVIEMNLVEVNRNVSIMNIGEGSLGHFAFDENN